MTAVYNTYDQKYLNKKNLLEEEDFLNDATSFLMDREGYSSDELSSNEEVYDAFMEHFRVQNVNEVTATRDLLHVQETDDEGRARMGRLMDTYDKMDSDFGLKALGDFAGGVFTAPSTYIGLGSFGAGKAAGLAANQALKLTIKQAIMKGAWKPALAAVAVDAPIAMGTVAAQEQTRVETGLKDEIDMTNVAIAGAISTVATGSLGLASGVNRTMKSFASERILRINQRKLKQAAEKSFKTVTSETFDPSNKSSKVAEEFRDILEQDALRIETEKLKRSKVKIKKANLSETIPEPLSKGKKLNEELNLTFEQKQIRNIASAATKIDELIPDLKNLPLDNAGKPKIERFSSRLTRGLIDGHVTSDDITKILQDHALTMEELGPLYAATISDAASIMGTVSAAAKKSKLKTVRGELVTRLNALDDATRDIGLITNPARKKIEEQYGQGWFAKLGNGISNASKARVGMMTIQTATTVRNTTNGYMRNYVYAMDNLGSGAINYSKGKILKFVKPKDYDGLGAKKTKELAEKEADTAVRLGVAQLKTGMEAVFLKDLSFGLTEMILGSNRFTEKFIRRETTSDALFKILRDKTFGKTDQVSKLLRELAEVGDTTGTEGGLLGVTRGLNTLNTMSDNMFKRAVFSRELNKSIRANPIQITSETGTKTINNLDQLLKTGRFNLIDDKSISDAMDKAFDFTYQTGDFNSRLGGFNSIAKGIIKVGQNPIGSTIIPFPRYLVNQFRFAYEHAPILGMVNVGGILNDGGYLAGKKGMLGTSVVDIEISTDTISKQLSGLGILTTFMALRANFGDENSGAYEYYDPTSNNFFDARASIGPFSAYAFFADLAYRQNWFNWHSNDKVNGNASTNTREMIEAIVGGQYRAGTGLALIDGLIKLMDDGVRAGASDAALKEIGVKFAGNLVNTATVGAGTLKDIVSVLDPSYRVLDDNTDVDMTEYFFKQAGRSLPPNIFAEVDETQRKLESTTRSGGIRRPNPFIKQLIGLSPVEERTIVEDEFSRLKIDYVELSPRPIKRDKPMTNEVKGLMGRDIEKRVHSFLQTPFYKNLSNDELKRIELKEIINEAKTEARNKILNPLRAKDDDELRRISLGRFRSLRGTEQDRLRIGYESKYDSNLDRDLDDADPEALSWIRKFLSAKN